MTLEHNTTIQQPNRLHLEPSLVRTGQVATLAKVLFNHEKARSSHPRNHWGADGLEQLDPEHG